jgi:hypothetical protein
MIFRRLENISPRNLRLLPQSTVKSAFIDENDHRNAIWDMLVTKEGRCFFSVCAELYVSESAGLYEYVYATNEVKKCFELDNVMCYASDAIMPSKIHTSMSEMNDGRIIMTTHTTSQSRVHPYWYPEPFYNHVFEGYQGSSILIYDPKTNALENRGVPIAHESIYGGTYDPTHNAFYFTGYLRGHLYRYDIDDGKITDYGKVTEFGSFRLFRSSIDGNIYSANRSGYFYRINTDTKEIEELQIFFEKDYEPYSTKKHVQLDYIADGKDGNIYLRYIFGYNFYRYNINENKLECIGDGRPKDLELGQPNQHYGLAVDEDGVLWYTVSTLTPDYDWTSAYLVCWDVLNGKEPKNMGIVGNKRQSINIMAEMHYHDGILYLTGGNHHFDVPGMFAVDIKKLKQLNYNLDEENIETPLSYDLINYLHIENARSLYPYSEKEYERQLEKAEIFRKYGDEFGKFMTENPMEIPHKSIVPYPFWRKYGYKNSQVYGVKYENGGAVIEFGGENKKFRYCAVTDVTEEITEFSAKDSVVNVPKDKVPFASGRNFRAIPTASARIFDNKYLVGTKDGLLFIWDGENSFNLGACPNTSGEVRQICYNALTRTAYGVIGSYNDISIVFAFDEKNGVRYLGRAHFNIESGLYLNAELSSIAVNDDGTKILIGSNENMGAAYEITL